ncbi:hypothetical protein Halru_2002 [Halovivax ruber XH-70]|uniref:DUF4332 domain-containing protein n=1 Tax=Halovivax ruber (strain DSM 18193 / JCM 13892 / XH-70) TaxID=797302 RepID=L0IEE2_HALRX|nr:helix-hairpin-helix domain-containing protein [Halovivax ruber]AGB16596.1 hypothetical protein Halru_2002 [Halovivax ruber XH-70]
MTELKTFLTALYDSFSEAELQALQHGRERYLKLVENGAIPNDGAVPVYHAANADVTLDVGLDAEETERGMEIYITDSRDGDESGLTFTVDLFDLVDIDDFDELDYEDILGAGTRPGRSVPRKPGDDVAAGDEFRDASGLSVDAVHGIGTQFSNDLADAGVETIVDLVAHTPEELATIVSSEGATVSPGRANDWIEQARGMITVLSGGQPIEFVDDIGPTIGGRLREHGIETLEQLVETDPAEIAESVSTDSRSVSPDRTARWLEEADALLAELESAENAAADDRPSAETDVTDET